jgi:hypothetical protein
MVGSAGRQRAECPLPCTRPLQQVLSQRVHCHLTWHSPCCKAGSCAYLSLDRERYTQEGLDLSETVEQWDNDDLTLCHLGL